MSADKENEKKNGVGANKGAAKAAAKAGAKPGVKAAQKAGGKAKAAEVPVKKEAKAPAVQPAEAGEVGVVRLKDFVERVTLAMNGKRPVVREHVDAILKQLVLAMEAGEDLKLSGVARFKTVKSNDTEKRSVMTVKVLRGTDKKSQKDSATPLA